MKLRWTITDDRAGGDISKLMATKGANIENAEPLQRKAEEVLAAEQSWVRKHGYDRKTGDGRTGTRYNKRERAKGKPKAKSARKIKATKRAAATTKHR